MEMGTWAFGKFNEIGLQGLQWFSSSAEKAREGLQVDGKGILTDYKESNGVTADRIKRTIEHVMQPLQTLEIAGVGGTLGLYFISCYTPMFKSVFFTFSLASAYFTFQVWNVKSAIHQEFFYYEKLGDELVHQDDFVKQVNNLGDRILASSALVRTLTSSDETKEFRKLGKLVEDLIAAKDDAALRTVLQRVPSVVKFFGGNPV